MRTTFPTQILRLVGLVAMAVGLAPLMSNTGDAEDLPQLICDGHKPDWQLELQTDQGTLTYRGTTQMTIPQRTQAEGAEFPKALTLIGGRNTAIVILNQRNCSTDIVTGFPFEANILTQKGETPVILAGCCRPVP